MSIRQMRGMHSSKQPGSFLTVWRDHRPRLRRSWAAQLEFSPTGFLLGIDSAFINHFWVFCSFKFTIYTFVPFLYKTFSVRLPMSSLHLEMKTLDQYQAVQPPYYSWRKSDVASGLLCCLLAVTLSKSLNSSQPPLSHPYNP